MSQNKNIWYILACGFLLFAAFVFIYEQHATERVQGYQEYKQGTDERRFVDVQIEKIEWTRDPNSHLLDPLQTKVQDNRIYVWDHGHTRLKVFDLDGRLQATIGRGRGKAPGELQSLMDFCVWDGHVWILDGHERRISIFDATDGTYVKQILLETEGSPNRIAPLGEHLIIRQLAPTEMFLKVDTTGQVLQRFGAMDDFTNRFDERNPLAFGGDLLSTGSTIVYGASKASFLHFFDAEGNMERTVRTIDGQPYGGPARPTRRRGHAFFCA